MIYQIVAIRDRAMDAYGRPFYVAALGQAIRSFQDEINRPADNNEMNRHPEDYDLYHLGNYDEANGCFTNLLPKPKQLAIGKEMKNAPE